MRTQTRLLGLLVAAVLAATAAVTVGVMSGCGEAAGLGEGGVTADAPVTTAAGQAGATTSSADGSSVGPVTDGGDAPITLVFDERASLPGSFPSVEDVSNAVTHVRMVMVYNPESRNEGELIPADSVTDTWFSPAEGAFRNEWKRGDHLEVVQVTGFDGKEYWGYGIGRYEIDPSEAGEGGPESGCRGYRFSGEFALEEFPPEWVDGFTKGEHNTAEEERLRMLGMVVAGELVQEGAGILDGRRVVQMKYTGGPPVSIIEGVLDECTSLPLVIRGPENTRYIDYEVVDTTSSERAALFAPEFPSGCTLVTEGQLRDITASRTPRELPVEELAEETGFVLLYAGSSFRGAELVRPKLLPDGTAELTYSEKGEDLSGTTYLVREWSASDTDRISTLQQGLEGAGGTPEEAGPDGDWTLYRDVFGGPNLFLVIGDTFVVLAKPGNGDAEDIDALLELASALREVQ